MIEFINEAFQLVNLPATGLLLLCLLYWLMVVVGAIGVDAFDIDFDADVDVGDLDVDGDFDSHAGGFSSIAEFMHLNHVPLVIVLSVFAMLFWITSFFGNHFLNPGGNGWVGLGLLSINVPACLLVTRVLIGPLAEGFKTQENDTTRESMIGLIGVVTTSEVSGSFGQVAIKQDGPEQVINARTNGQAPNLGKGDMAKIMAYDYETDTYMVELCKWTESKT